MRTTICLALSVPTFCYAQSSEEEALARAIFADLNPVSIEQNIEFCGYIGFTANGELAHSRPARGTIDSCLVDDPMNLDLIVASYHTHAAFSRDYNSEIPSGTDMEGDEDEGIDGWVATPNGWLWYIDTTDMVTRQIYGIGCLPADPAFVEGDSGLIEQSYSYGELVRKLEE